MVGSTLLTWVNNPARARPVERVLPKRIENWALRRLQQRSVMTGERMIWYVQYYRQLRAERPLMQRLFGSLVWRIAPLSVQTG
jgi:hypothetical protein